mgnify:CR=1 FL=1
MSATRTGNEERVSMEATHYACDSFEEIWWQTCQNKARKFGLILVANVKENRKLCGFFPRESRFERIMYTRFLLLCKWRKSKSWFICTWWCPSVLFLVMMVLHGSVPGQTECKIHYQMCIIGEILLLNWNDAWLVCGQIWLSGLENT